MDNRVGFKINFLSNTIKRKSTNIEAIIKLDNISGTNGFIIVYIYKSKIPVYQKDLERVFGITRSTASKTITLMEKKGLVVRKSVSNDARLKELTLTDIAKSYCKEVLDGIDKLEERITKGFSEDELKLLYNFFDRIYGNLNEEDNINA